MSVQVRRADGEPAVVDDPDLGVDVDRIAELPGSRVDRASEEACGLVGCVNECRDLSARDVGAVVGTRRQEDEQPELVAGWVAQLVGQDRDDLRRPQELVLEVDEPLG